MSTEIIWKELSCPMTGGDLCTRSACMGASCGYAGQTVFYDKGEEIIEPYEETKTRYKGWWFWRKTVTTKIKKERKYIVRHICKKVNFSYITCLHHQNSNIGIKITVEDADFNTSSYLRTQYPSYNCEYNEVPMEGFSNTIQKLRDSINRDCVYDSSIQTKIGENE